MNLTPTTPVKSDPDHLDSLIPETAAAQFLGYTVRALQNWRLRGGGPAFIKVSSRSVRYRRRDLIEWANQHRVPSTSNVPAGAKI